MQPLTIEKTYRILLGDVNSFRILLVGVGGTGSTLALFLAGLMYHARQKGIQVELTLVDHDVVEMKNCGRQAVSVQAAMAGGIPKVADLALRINAAYGLDVAAWPVRYEARLGSEWFNHSVGGRSQPHLIIGCVDNHVGRREIAKTVEAYHGRIWALDCGNERVSGQVLIGNMTDVSQIKLDRLGLCSGLPSPYLQEPGLLEPDPEAQSQSCAAMAAAETQSLMVNRLAATIAGHYVAGAILHKQIIQMGTYFSLEPTVMTARLITEANVNQYKKKRRPK
ncbi:MAG: ThiF family adenylyltransferase [Chloroflexi bacterium]|nr:ThiF family adenylyltransferase [Chloroflexota bacterium]MCI0728592.1 ThiF family adenylyltransferase [Chloroflexota bacterium]